MRTYNVTQLAVLCSTCSALHSTRCSVSALGSRSAPGVFFFDPSLPSPLLSSCLRLKLHALHSSLSTRSFHSIPIPTRIRLDSLAHFAFHCIPLVRTTLHLLFTTSSAQLTIAFVLGLSSVALRCVALRYVAFGSSVRVEVKWNWSIGTLASAMLHTPHPTATTD